MENSFLEERRRALPGLEGNGFLTCDRKNGKNS